MSYCKTKVRRNQQHFKDPEVSITVKEDVQTYIAELPKGKLAVLKQLFYWKDKFPSLYISQNRIAKTIGLSREHVNRILSDFEKDGLVSLYYRHMKTSMYKVSSFFTDEVRVSISYLFRVFPITLLLSIPVTEACFKETSHDNKKNNIYIINRPVEREFISQARVYDGTAFIKKEKKTMLLPSQKRELILKLKAGAVPRDFIPPSIQEVKSVNLSIYGAVKLMAFPATIIKQADWHTQKATNIREPFDFLFGKCIKLCKEKNIKPDWPWVDALKKALHFNDDLSPVIIEPAVENPIKKQTTLQEKKESEWKSGREDLDRTVEFSKAEETLERESHFNVFAAILCKKQ